VLLDRGDLITTLEDILRRRDWPDRARFKVMIERPALPTRAVLHGHGASLSLAAVPYRRRRHLGRYGE
jgi:hypothetical protein